MAWLVFLASIVLLAACAEEKSASDVIEDYIKAIAAGDADKAVSLSCADWELEAQKDANGFKPYESEIENLSCQTDGKDGDFTRVVCEGKIITNYGVGGVREVNLSNFVYLAVQEDDEWKMCQERPAE